MNLTVCFVLQAAWARLVSNQASSRITFHIYMRIQWNMQAKQFRAQAARQYSCLEQLELF